MFTPFCHKGWCSLPPTEDSSHRFTYHNTVVVTGQLVPHRNRQTKRKVIIVTMFTFSSLPAPSRLLSIFFYCILCFKSTEGKTLSTLLPEKKFFS